MKRILMEDQDLEALSKLGLAYEHSNTKTKAMCSNDAGPDCIQRMEEGVVRLKLQKRSHRTGQLFPMSSKCQTCLCGKRRQEVNGVL